MKNKPHKLFISHSSKDAEYMKAFVDRFRDKVRNGEALEKISEVCFTVFFAESYIDGEKGRLSIRNLKVTPAYE